MEWYYLTFRSITPAQRGERLLKRKGIAVSLMRAVRQISAEGCGYSLRIRPQHAGEVVELFRQNEIPFRKLFLQSASGEIKELEL